jgi:CheY-like chemotaxis protein
MAQNALQEYGYTTVTAENGLEAVDLVRRAPDRFRAVLLDMTMPVMGGEEAIAHLQRLCPDLPVLVSSGYGEMEALRRFQGARVAGFLQKPYTARQLVDALRAALAGAG